jgi:Ni,Fe-hydrogenase I small subunit
MAMIISRRQFLKWSIASAAALGLSQTDILKLKEAYAAACTGCVDLGLNAPHVIWFQGQSCGGCTLSILNRMPINDDPLPELNVTGSGVVKDIVDLLVGDAVGTLTTGAARAGWAPFPRGYITLDYQTEVMASAGGQYDIGAGYVADPGNIGTHVKCITDTEPFVLCISGAIPAIDRKLLARTGGVFNAQPTCVAGSFDTGDGNLWERSIVEILEWLAPKTNCVAVLSFGTCASWGGIPSAHGNATQATSVYGYLVKVKGYDGAHSPKPDLSGKIINIPGCAPHPDWMIYPVVWAYLYLHGSVTHPTLTPPLDTSLRNICVWANASQHVLFSVPKNTCRDIYTGDKGYTVFCEVCPKYSESNLCNDLGAGLGNGDGSHQKEWCTRNEGCNGPYASPDCPTRNWNNFDDGTHNQWCVGNLPCGPNYVCQGCAEPDFPDGRSPFFSSTKGYPWSW